MEYRLKYRDIPWVVAFIVLPGKVLGTVFIAWPARYIANWRHNSVIVGLVAIMAVVLAVMIHYITDGTINLFAIFLEWTGVIK